MNEVQQVTEVAKSISDYGVLIIIGAIYLLLSSAMMIAIFKWFKSIINRILAQQDEFKPIIEAIRENGTLMRQIAEGLRPETQLRIRNLSGFAFDLSVEQVCRMIKRVREENHISDKEATKIKIRKLLHNIHEDRKSRFDPFTYEGKCLSEYCNAEWIEKVALVVEGELYNPNGIDNKRAYTNVKMVYDDIKLDFYHRMND